MVGRPTRAHPGASPLRSLDDLKPKRKTRKTATKVKNEVALATPAISHEDATITSRLQSPPTNTSPSQSPQPESGSQSPLAPESSGSTSPPAMPYTQPQTRRENSKEQKQVTKRAGSTRASPKNPKKRSRVDQGPPTHQGVETSDDDSAGDQRPAKRARNKTGSYTLKNESRKQNRSAHQAAGTSSAHDAPVSQQLTSYTPSQSISNQIPHTASPQPEHKSSENEWAAQPSKATRTSPLTPFNLPRRRPFLTARSSKQGQSRERELVPDDMAERARLYQERFGCPMPQLMGTPKIFGRNVEESFIEDEGEEESNSEDLGQNTYDPKKSGRNNISNNSPQSADYLESAPSGRKIGAGASSSRPSTKPSKFSKPLQPTRVVPTRVVSTRAISTQIVIPETRTEQELVLTRPNITDLVRAVATWAEQDESRRVPNPREMVAYLESYNSQQKAKASQATTTSTPQRQLEERGPEASASHNLNSAQRSHRRNSDYHSMLLGDNDEEANAKDESEVQASPPEPQTPASQSTPKAQESRAWWSGVSAVKNMLKTPFTYFGGRRNSPGADAVTTNGEPVTAMPVPQTSDFSRPPSTPTPLLGRGRAAAQSERRRRVLTPQKGRSSTFLPQTERRPRHGDEPKPPIHLRGIVSAERIAEIHRQQDLQAEARQMDRDNHTAKVEEEDELAANQPLHLTQTGEKRKRTTQKCPPGTYRFPSSDSSSDDSDDDNDGEVVENEPDRAKALPQAIRTSPQVSFTEEELRGIGPLDLTAYEKRFYVMHGKYPAEGHALDFYCMIDAEWQTNIRQNIANRLGPKDTFTRTPHSTPEEIAAIHARIRASYTDPFSTYDASPPQKSSASHKSSASYSGSTSRNNSSTYTGSLFRQPAAVQANIDEGLYPVTPRLSSSRQHRTPNIFEADRKLTPSELFLKGVQESVEAANSAQKKWKPQPPPANLFSKATPHTPNSQSASLFNRVTAPKGDSQAEFFGKPETSSLSDSAPAGHAQVEFVSKKYSTSEQLRPQAPSIPSFTPASRSSVSFGKPASTSKRSKPKNSTVFQTTPDGRSSASLFGKPTYSPSKSNIPTPFKSNPDGRSSANLFGKLTSLTPMLPMQSLFPEEIQRFWNKSSRNIFDKVNLPNADSQSAAKSKPEVFSNSFQVPDGSDSNSDEEEVDQRGKNGKRKEDEIVQNGQSTNESVQKDRSAVESLQKDESADEGLQKGQSADESLQKDQSAKETVLQEKQWTQTPPPKPRPGNAQLPQQPAQPTAADIAKSKANPFAPKQPSRLRNVTQMSPLQIEQENRVREAQTGQGGARQDILQPKGSYQPLWEKNPEMAHFQRTVREDWESYERGLDLKVKAHLGFIDDTILPMEVPPECYEERSGFDVDPVVEQEVFRLLP